MDTTEIRLSGNTTAIKKLKNEAGYKHLPDYLFHIVSSSGSGEMTLKLKVNRDKLMSELEEVKNYLQSLKQLFEEYGENN